MSDRDRKTTPRAGWSDARIRDRWGASLVAVSMVLMGGCSMRQMIYPAPGIAVGEPPGGFEEVVLQAHDGSTIIGWHWPGASGRKDWPALLFFHGNGENLETLRLSGSLSELTGLGAPYLVIDYPGYGRSTGAPSEATVKRAAEAALDWLCDRYPERPHVLVGWSLGAAVAIHLAAENEASDGLIALSPWTSLSDVAAIHFPTWLTSLLLHESYDSMGLATEIACPTLLLHGARDRIIPVSQGRLLAAAVTAAEMLEIETAGHNDLLAEARVWQKMEQFLAGVGRRTAV